MSDVAIAHLTHRFKGTREKKSANEPFSWQDADKLEVEWTETGMAYVAHVEQSDHCFAFVHSPKPFKSVVACNYFHNVQRELGIRTTFNFVCACFWGCVVSTSAANRRSLVV